MDACRSVISQAFGSCEFPQYSIFIPVPEIQGPQFVMEVIRLFIMVSRRPGISMCGARLSAVFDHEKISIKKKTCEDYESSTGRVGFPTAGDTSAPMNSLVAHAEDSIDCSLRDSLKVDKLYWEQVISPYALIMTAQNRTRADLESITADANCSVKKKKRPKAHQPADAAGY